MAIINCYSIRKMIKKGDHVYMFTERKKINPTKGGCSQYAAQVQHWHLKCLLKSNIYLQLLIIYMISTKIDLQLKQQARSILKYHLACTFQENIFLIIKGW